MHIIICIMHTMQTISSQANAFLRWWAEKFTKSSCNSSFMDFNLEASPLKLSNSFYKFPRNPRVSFSDLNIFWLDFPISVISPLRLSICLICFIVYSFSLYLWFCICFLFSKILCLSSSYCSSFWYRIIFVSSLLRMWES